MLYYYAIAIFIIICFGIQFRKLDRAIKNKNKGEIKFSLFILLMMIVVACVLVWLIFKGSSISSS